MLPAGEVDRWGCPAYPFRATSRLMRVYVANTDYDWYRHLARLAALPGGLDEANFWRPSGRQVVGYLSFGDPFVFKLKKAHGHAIVGFGFWVAFAHLSIQEAWDTFGERNGAPSREAVWRRVAQYVPVLRTSTYRPSHPIGCDLLASPIFFPEDLWVPGPSGWSDNTVTGAGYDVAHGEGRRIWQACLEHAAALGPGIPVVADPTEGAQPSLFNATDPVQRYGAEQVVRPRLGQGTFRFALQKVYGKCAVTREHSFPALDASHIVPYTAGGSHDIPNGLLLRADVHKLFDRGYVTVTPDYRFRVSPRLAHEFHNGKVYYQLEGTELWLPERIEDRPDPRRLERHNDEVFLAH
jgi:putative restriction endonuclease